MFSEVITMLMCKIDVLIFFNPPQFQVLEEKEA